ncbi:hypothetical protein, partial [Paenibacillus residui]
GRSSFSISAFSNSYTHRDFTLSSLGGRGGSTLNLPRFWKNEPIKSKSTSIFPSLRKLLQNKCRNALIQVVFG